MFLFSVPLFERKLFQFCFKQNPMRRQRPVYFNFCYSYFCFCRPKWINWSPKCLIAGLQCFCDARSSRVNSGMKFLKLVNKLNSVEEYFTVEMFLVFFSIIIELKGTGTSLLAIRAERVGSIISFSVISLIRSQGRSQLFLPSDASYWNWFESYPLKKVKINEIMCWPQHQTNFIIKRSWKIDRKLKSISKSRVQRGLSS